MARPAHSRRAGTQLGAHKHGFRSVFNQACDTSTVNWATGPLGNGFLYTAYSQIQLPPQAMSFSDQIKQDRGPEKQASCSDAEPMRSEIRRRILRWDQSITGPNSSGECASIVPRSQSAVRLSQTAVLRELSCSD